MTRANESDNIAGLALAMRAWIQGPIRDYFAALDRCLARNRLGNALLLALSVGVSWWIYVPLHELLHVAGCVVSGGVVTRLDLDPKYGAALLKHIFPFISTGSDYAGQLSGFDTRDSDLIYLATDFAPFLLTIAFGVPLVRHVAAGTASARKSSILFGVALPSAYAPLVSLFGDYFEMGTIVVSRVVSWLVPAFVVGRWRGDDLEVVLQRMEPAGPSIIDVIGLLGSLLTGAALALLTFWLGHQVSRYVWRSTP